MGKKKSTVGEGRNFNQTSVHIITKCKKECRRQTKTMAAARRVGRNPRDMAERGSCKDGVENLAEVLLGSKNMQEMLIR